MEREREREVTFRYFITSTFGCLFYDFSLFNQTTKSVVPICHRRALSLSAADAKAASECDWALALLFAPPFYITYYLLLCSTFALFCSIGW
mgnify:CR=1 FL=1